MNFGGDTRIFSYFFGSCLVVGKSNLKIVKGSYHFPTVPEINIFNIFKCTSGSNPVVLSP